MVINCLSIYLRSHLAECYVRQTMTPFPTKRKCRISNPILTTVTLYVCPQFARCQREKMTWSSVTSATFGTMMSACLNTTEI